MPTNKVIQPFLNPVKFIEWSPTGFTQYRSKHFDDYFFQETILPWQQPTQYLQPWQKSDSIRLQFQSQLAPIKWSLIDKDEVVYNSANFQDMQQNADDPDWRIYQADIALAAYAEGLYFLKLEFGNADVNGKFPLALISEPLHIAIEHKNTLYLEYKHHEYYGDVIFETGFAPSIRIRATLRFKSPSSKDTFFEDQPLDMQMLHSKPFRLYELLIGGARGIPDYLADILNRIFGCSTLSIDGKLYTKNEGSRMEEREAANYPMRGWAIELREAVNKASKQYADGSSQNGRITIIATVEGKGFSQTDVGGSEEQIQEFI